MKTFLFSLISSCFFCSLTAQEVLSTSSLADPYDIVHLINHGNYAMDTNNERAQYIGTWRYESNGLLFELKVDAADQFLQQFPDGSKYFFWDALILKYRLVENDVEIYNNLNATVTPNHESIGLKQGDREYLSGRIKDFTRNVTGTFSITKLNNNPEKIYFMLYLSGYTLHNPREFYDDGQPLFSLPTNGVEMIKVE